MTEPECQHPDVYADGADTDGSQIWVCRVCHDRWNDGMPGNAYEPRQEQLDQAVTHGIEYALAEINAGNAGPQDAPLSGEWADGLLPQHVAGNVGYHEPDPVDDGGVYADGVTELGDAWERGYFDTWSVYLANIQGGRNA